MVHGGAGAGKSTVINVVALWFQKILQQEGDSIDQPYVLKTSFTGCAAANIEGLTLHKAFGFAFGNQHFSLSDKIRDQRRTIMKNLKLLIIAQWKSVLVMGGQIFFIHLISYFPSKYDLCPSLNDK